MLRVHLTHAAFVLTTHCRANCVGSFASLQHYTVTYLSLHKHRLMTWQDHACSGWKCFSVSNLNVPANTMHMSGRKAHRLCLLIVHAFLHTYAVSRGGLHHGKFVELQRGRAKQKAAAPVRNENTYTETDVHTTNTTTTCCNALDITCAHMSTCEQPVLSPFH